MQNLSLRVLAPTLALVLLLGCDDGADPDAGPAADATMDAGGAVDAGGSTMDAGDGNSDGGPGMPDAGPPMTDAGVDAGVDAGIMCSNELFGLTSDSLCNSALGEIMGTSADCPAAPPGWRANHLVLGTIVYCGYEADPLVPLADFCTLPVGPMGEPPWVWLGPDCIVVGPG